MATGASQRGLALVLVIVVLLALVLIATPFVLSMGRQERSATTHKDQHRADFGAEGAKNYAAWRMMRGHDHMERRNPTVPWTSYYYDTQAELQARAADLLPPDRIANSQGAIWGVQIQDEQGKINVNSAPATLIQRFAGTTLIDSRVQDLKDFLTLYSARQARWIFPQRIRGVGSVQIDPTTTIQGVGVDNAMHYGRNGRLRLTKPGLSALEVTVERNWLTAGFNVVETKPSVPGGYDGGIVEMEQRHPVNLNTAPREVLIALFQGLRLAGGNDPAISQDQARRLADRFYRKQTTRIESFGAALVAANEITAEQKLAVGLNAINPFHVSLDNTGTMPLTFQSYDVLTMESFSSMNALSGVETAGRGFREVVSIAPPTVLQYILESQYDFDAHLQFATALSAIASNVLQFYGYPFGNKIVTYPNMVPNPSDTQLKPQSAQQEVFFEIAPARDNRGSGMMLNWREHFDTTQEGQELQGGTIVYNWNRVFAPYPQGAAPPVQMPDVAAGGIEFWVRFDQQATAIPFFDLRQGDTTNRVSLHYDVSTGVPELVLTLADGTLGSTGSLIDNGTAQIRFPFLPTADKTWYHIGAYWKGTRYAHAMLLVDGFAHPNAKFMHYSPEGNRILTTLRSALDTSATNWVLADGSIVPTNEPSVWMIGSEVVLYDPVTGQLVRGARGTAAQDHPADATVQIFGYSSRLRPVTVTANFAQLGKPAAGSATLTFDRIPTGGGQLTYAVGATPTATVMGDKQDPNNPGLTFIDASQNFIDVISPDITQYPDQGHVMIEDEVIFYTGRQASPPRFTGCQRGQHGTVAAQHNTGQQIQLWGFAATDTTNYLSPTILQVDGEWFGPAYRDAAHANHWIGHVNGAIPGPFLRQVMGSLQFSHAAGAEILPVWAARESDAAVSRQNIGPSDRVTLTDAQVQNEYKRILHAGQQGNGWQFSIADAQLAGFTNNVLRDYIADELHVRVLKFPSGELLGLNYLQTYNPSFTIGPMNATIDEIHVTASSKGNFATSSAVNANATGVPMNNSGSISASGGAVKIGDEIVGFARNQNNVLDPAVRGYLNSQPQVHDQGDLAFNLSFLPIAALAAPVSATAADLRITAGSTPNAIDLPEGYAVLRSANRDEVVMYTAVWDNPDGTRTLRMPSKLESPGEGMFRGRFGTPPLDHDQDRLVYFLPYRWWDTYAPRQFDNRMAYYQATAELESARIRRVAWTEEKPANDANLRTHLLLRIDGKGEWFDATGKEILEFTDPAGKDVNRIAYQNDAGRLELRFYFQYQGGFWPQHTWKRATRIKEVRVDYDRPTRTLYHEDR